MVSARLGLEVCALWNALNPRDDVPTTTESGVTGITLTEKCMAAALVLPPEDMPDLWVLLDQIRVSQLFRNEVIHTAFFEGAPTVRGHRGFNRTQRKRRDDLANPSKMFSRDVGAVRDVVRRMLSYFKPIDRMLPGSSPSPFVAIGNTGRPKRGRRPVSPFAGARRTVLKH